MNAPHPNQGGMSLTLADATACGHSVDVSLIEVAAGTDVTLIGVAPTQMIETAHVVF